jgi:hypothetical protein
MHHRKHMSHDHHPPLRAVTAGTEDTVSSIVRCWTAFTELLPGNALVKSVTIFLCMTCVGVSYGIHVYVLTLW